MRRPRNRSGVNGEPYSIEYLEKMLAVAAYIVARHGTKYAPIMYRLEREVEAARKGEDALVRANQILETYGVTGGVEPLLLPPK